MIGRSDERGSGISVLAARHDDDDDRLFIPWFGLVWFYSISTTVGHLMTNSFIHI